MANIVITSDACDKCTSPQSKAVKGTSERFLCVSCWGKYEAGMFPLVKKQPLEMAA